MNQRFSPHHDREVFLEKLNELASDLECQGLIPGEPKLPKSDKNLNIEQMLVLQVMMGNLDGVTQCLKLGADSNCRFKNRTLLTLAKAYGHKDIVEALKEFGAKESFKKRPTV